MGGCPPFQPDWRDAAGYAPLLEAGPSALAWEWLRRDPLYRDAARAVAAARTRATAGAGARRGTGDALVVLHGDEGAARWGLHAFEDPDLPAATAWPVWRREVFPHTLVAATEADADQSSADRFDLARFAAIATVVRDEGAEHVLLSDGLASLRLDMAAGSLLVGPVCLAWRLAGIAALDGPLATLHALVRLCRSGRLDPPRPRSRNRRLVLLLRAHDALRAGASQRAIAGELLSREAAQVRWRTEAPSLRLQAQRLAGGARAMARGGYRALLAG